MRLRRGELQFGLLLIAAFGIHFYWLWRKQNQLAPGWWFGVREFYLYPGDEDVSREYRLSSIPPDVANSVDPWVRQFIELPPDQATNVYCQRWSNCPPG